MPAMRIRLDQTALLVVDVQEKLLPHIEGGEAVVAGAVKLIRGCAALGVPIVATEQYPRGLGSMVAAIREALPEGVEPESKLKFSGCVEPVRRRLAELGRPTVLICGIETHVCVLQTALDLLEAGFVAAVAGDAVGSRKRADHDLALMRLRGAGVVLSSVESALLEMIGAAGTDRFKAVLPIIK